jgi:hypothetical protein
MRRNDSPQRIASLSQQDLYRLTRNLSDEWLLIGQPDEPAMPRWMLAQYVELKRELERRGTQMRLC